VSGSILGAGAAIAAGAKVDGAIVAAHERVDAER
jgi:hypothetical protein